MKAPNVYQKLCIAAIFIVVGIALWICYNDCAEAKMHYSGPLVVLLGIAYVAHIFLKLWMHRHKKAERYIWVTRLMILGLSLIPILVSHSAPASNQQASSLTIETSLPIILLGVIEGLLAVYCYIFTNKKAPRGGRGAR